MAEGITVKFDPDPSVLSGLIERIQRDTGKSLEDAVRIAAWYLAGSLSASTKTAKKKRGLRKNKGKEKSRPTWVYPHYVNVYRKDSSIARHYIKVGEETTDPAIVIPKAGLAKSSWKWMLGDLGKPRKAKHGRIAGAVSVRSIGTEKDPAWQMENRLNYIESAIRHSGRAPIETAFQRAINSGNRKIDGMMAKAIAKGKA